MKPEVSPGCAVYQVVTPRRVGVTISVRRLARKIQPCYFLAFVSPVVGPVWGRPAILVATRACMFRSYEGFELNALRISRIVTDATQISDESRRMGLKINIPKTNVMVVDNTPINVNTVLVQHVEGYVYLGQNYSFKEKNQDNEMTRRIKSSWVAYVNTRISSNATIMSSYNVLRLGSGRGRVVRVLDSGLKGREFDPRIGHACSPLKLRPFY